MDELLDDTEIFIDEDYNVPVSVFPFVFYGMNPNTSHQWSKPTGTRIMKPMIIVQRNTDQIGLWEFLRDRYGVDQGEMQKLQKIYFDKVIDLMSKK
jgi:hypothetical protein